MGLFGIVLMLFGTVWVSFGCMFEIVWECAEHFGCIVGIVWDWLR